MLRNCTCHAEYARRGGNTVNSERGGPIPGMLFAEWRFRTILLHFVRKATNKSWRPSCKSRARASRPKKDRAGTQCFAIKAAGNPGKPRPNPGEKVGLV